MITKTKYKICRRLGSGIYAKCATPQFSASESRKSNVSAKTKGKGGKGKALSDYGRQLIEKQKLRFTYGLNERQLTNYVKEAVSKKGVDLADDLFGMLESRLDNIVYRLGLANSRRMARQIVSHGHIVVGDRKITIPSYKVLPNDKLRIREGSSVKPLFANLEEKMKDYTTPSWLSFDIKKKEAVMKGLPNKKDGGDIFDFKSIMEFYSR